VLLPVILPPVPQPAAMLREAREQSSQQAGITVLDWPHGERLAIDVRQRSVQTGLQPESHAYGAEWPRHTPERVAHRLFLLVGFQC
jgi:hypothetical protein